MKGVSLSHAYYVISTVCQLSICGSGGIKESWTKLRQWDDAQNLAEFFFQSILKDGKHYIVKKM